MEIHVSSKFFQVLNRIFESGVDQDIRDFELHREKEGGNLVDER
jgi:hypothetical protein